jgi:hypothetical protein
VTLTLGRVGVDIALRDPSVWARDGNRVTLSGFFSGGATVADGVTLSEQLLGLADNPDEPVIACAWSEEAWFDGYYRVSSVAVPALPGGLLQGWHPYTIQLERVADGASPRVDSTLVGALLTNANSVTSGTLRHFVPGAAYSYYGRGGALTAAGVDLTMTGTTVNRTSETGIVSGARRATISAVTNGFASYECAPADYYDGACIIRAGTTLRRVIGQRMKRLPVNWQIDNGLIRITPGAIATLVTEVFNGTAWEDSRTYWMGTTANLHAGSPNKEFIDVSVLRNSPEQCIVRVTIGYPLSQNNAGDSMIWDVGVKRGAFHATIRMAYANQLAAGGAIALGNATASAATAITGGLRQTSNSAAGNRWVLARIHPTVAATNETTQGAVSGTNVQNALIVVGYEFNGSSAVAEDAAQQIINEAYYPMSERMVPRVR